MLRFSSVSLANWVEALLYGLAIVGAAFILSWAAEVAQLDISAGLAIAVLAFIAVLPEYAVDMVLAWEGGTRSSSTGGMPSAGRCGAEDLLARARQHDRRQPAADRDRLVDGRLHRRVPLAQDPPVLREVVDRHSVEVAFLGLATVYSLLPEVPDHADRFRDPRVDLRRLHLADLEGPAEEPHLVGPAGSGRSERRTAGQA